MQFLPTRWSLCRLITPNRFFRPDFPTRIQKWTVSSSPVFDQRYYSSSNHRSAAPVHRFPILDRWKYVNPVQKSIFGLGLENHRYLRTAATQNAITGVKDSVPLQNQTRRFAEKPEEKKEDKIAPIEEDETKLTLAQKFKKMWKQYWYVLLPVHGVTCCLYFGILYGISASGLDVISFLEFLHIPDSLLNKIRNAPQAGHVVIAFALYKIITPLRYMTTLGVTYYAVKTLSRLGYIKPMPSRKQIKAMIDVKTDEFRAKRQRWRAERLKKRGTNGSNGHHHPTHHPKRKPHE